MVTTKFTDYPLIFVVLSWLLRFTGVIAGLGCWLSHPLEVHMALLVLQKLVLRQGPFKSDTAHGSLIFVSEVHGVFNK